MVNSRMPYENDMNLYEKQELFYKIGNLYLNGEDVSQNKKEAVLWWKKASAYGNPYAEWMIAIVEGKDKPLFGCEIRDLEKLSDDSNNELVLIAVEDELKRRAEKKMKKCGKVKRRNIAAMEMVHDRLETCRCRKDISKGFPYEKKLNVVNTNYIHRFYEKNTQNRCPVLN
ncbi:hypothetical protein NB643_06980 [Oxalobacter aliiformigenes]|uniref:Sel1 repeat family protein n=1 Tax=Oxalobacter aliiformigenes TaxID=2946593 RepID=A0ABY7JJ41_9BURK|nr:hypothetical protein [Oxalobacter aliiformigenes]WAV93931.1 hypothetical protein NB641_04140 [Oxalobacter aliiformigenes]WAV94568.1 hypothetical protein NB643_06980 [Oxalobacter aliiformigenes]WAV97627.1 hypothetical protein NB645_02475 [Oxalobacter aliiformigenes]